MKANGSTAPSASFTITKAGEKAIITFYENASCSMVQDGSDQERLVWEWNEYTIERPYRESYEADIEANYATWLQTAKQEEEERTPVDEHQMRADLDYVMITSQATSPYAISTMSLEEPASDSEVLSKCQTYYPQRWTIDQLRYLVMLQKLSAQDFQTVTGEVYTA